MTQVCVHGTDNLNSDKKVEADKEENSELGSKTEL